MLWVLTGWLWLLNTFKSRPWNTTSYMTMLKVFKPDKGSTPWQWSAQASNEDITLEYLSIHSQNRKKKSYIQHKILMTTNVFFFSSLQFVITFLHGNFVINMYRQRTHEVYKLLEMRNYPALFSCLLPASSCTCLLLSRLWYKYIF